jgi:hypothetical protein
MRLHAGRVLPTYVGKICTRQHMYICCLYSDRNREVKNTLAYYDSEFITTENNFIVEEAAKNLCFS